MNLTAELIDEEGKGILFARVASKLLSEGKVDQATLISEVGIKKHPNYAQGHYILGKCYQDRDMYEEARAEYERVLRYDSSHLGAMKELASLYHSTELNDVYKDYLYRLLTLDPLNSRILDECREEGVYEIWKSQGERPLVTENDITTEETEFPEFKLDKENKTIEEEVEAEKKNAEDLLKIDLTQFENQDDDFTTIMDGLIQESSEDGHEVDATNYLKDLESPVEIESELLAEEKPIEESIDELDAFDKADFNDDTNSTFLELDYGQKIEKKEEEIIKDKDDNLELNKEEDTIQLEEEIKKEPEEVENAFDEPKLRVENIEVKDEPSPGNAHEKTELVFEETEKNVEFQFDEEESLEEVKEEIKIEPELKIEQDITKEKDEIPELEIEPEIIRNVEEEKKLESETDLIPEVDEEDAPDEKSPYVKQKIVSQTLGEILVSQNKYNEAKQVFLALKEQQPDNPNIDKKLEILDKIIALEEKKE
jgi:tetratricopeptide (TPR) repeat protein